MVLITGSSSEVYLPPLRSQPQTTISAATAHHQHRAIGRAVSLLFSFAVAPLAFVVLHVFTLVRYDMFSTNMRPFRADLEAMCCWEVDRERCRQLLINVEFVVSRAVPRGSPLQSRIFRVIAFGL
jgi:hypothetical protein